MFQARTSSQKISAIRIESPPSQYYSYCARTDTHDFKRGNNWSAIKSTKIDISSTENKHLGGKFPPGEDVGVGESGRVMALMVTGTVNMPEAMWVD